MAKSKRGSELALFGGPRTISPEDDFKSAWPRMGLEKGLYGRRQVEGILGVLGKKIEEFLKP